MAQYEERKKFLKSYDLQDLLDEDPVINNQKFFVMSYILPDNNSNELKFPIIKVRGSYSTQDDCLKRIEKLKNIDKYHDIFICEVGKYGSLLPKEEYEKLDDVDVQYREAILNTMVKEYKENKDKSDLEFENRKEFLRKRAEYEGTVKGQEELSTNKESVNSVKERISAYTKQKKDMEERLLEIAEILELSKEQLEKNYTLEEKEVVDTPQKEN